MFEYNIARDFTDVPGPRYIKLGKFSGEKFRSVLIKLLEEHEAIELVLDGAEGYPSSFLEESFGGLVRLGYQAEEIRKRFKIIADDPEFEFYLAEINDYINDEQAKQSAGSSK